MERDRGLDPELVQWALTTFPLLSWSDAGEEATALPGVEGRVGKGSGSSAAPGLHRPSMKDRWPGLRACYVPSVISFNPHSLSSLCK